MSSIALIQQGETPRSPALARSPSSLSRVVSAARLSLSPSSPALVRSPSRLSLSPSSPALVRSPSARGLFAPAKSDAENARAEMRARSRAMVERARETQVMGSKQASALVRHGLHHAASPPGLLPTASQMLERSSGMYTEYKLRRSKSGSREPELAHQVDELRRGAAPVPQGRTPSAAATPSVVATPTAAVAAVPGLAPAEALPDGDEWDPLTPTRQPTYEGQRPLPAKLPRIQTVHLDSGLSELQSGSILTDAHAVFTLMDRGTTGTLDMAEVADLRRRLKRIHPDRYPAPLTPGFAEQIVSRVKDKDGDGVVSRPEWIDFVIAQSKEKGERPVQKLLRVIARELARRWA